MGGFVSPYIPIPGLEFLDNFLLLLLDFLLGSFIV